MLQPGCCCSRRRATCMPTTPAPAITKSKVALARMRALVSPRAQLRRAAAGEGVDEAEEEQTLAFHGACLLLLLLLLLAQLGWWVVCERGVSMSTQRDQHCHMSHVSVSVRLALQKFRIARQLLQNRMSVGKVAAVTCTTPSPKPV
jgi:hypothetical protein